jgi:hypothetical protein
MRTKCDGNHANAQHDGPKRLRPACIQRGRKPRAAALLVAGLAALGACTPALNWREIQLDESARVALPCRPQKDERPVMLAGRSVLLRLRACEAGQAVWAVSSAQAADAGHALAVVAELQRSLVDNLQGTGTVLPEAPGAAPGQRVRLAVAGRHADGSAVAARAAFVSHEGNVFQLVVMPRNGAKLPTDEALGYFFDSLAFDPAQTRR